jgi:hypothetical protein
MSKDLWQATEKGTAYLKDHGRAVDKALFAFEHEGGSVEAVTAELEKYQNEDGGFGHAYEPDLRCPDSSALCTTEVMQTCWKLGLDGEHSLFKGAVEYFLSTYIEEHKGWHFIPESSQNYPRAPWWEFNSDPSTNKHNPRPEILAILWRARAVVPVELLNGLISSVLADFKEDVEGLVMHDLYCYLRLVRTPDLREDIKAVLMEHIPAIITKEMKTTEEEWASYGVRPYAITQDQADPFYPLVAESMPAAFEYLLKEQLEDGSWPLTWNWGGNFPETWLEAEKEWKSRITLENLHLLKHLGPLVLP